jgi:hypothetical protein
MVYEFASVCPHPGIGARHLGEDLPVSIPDFNSSAADVPESDVPFVAIKWWDKPS